MTPKEKAKELVNKFYQPLGHLKCMVSSNEMWEHAKQRAIEALKENIFWLDKLYQLIQKSGQENEIIQTLYEKTFTELSELKTEIEKL